MTSIFSRFLSIGNDQRQLQQFRKQVEKLNEQRESQKNDSSFDEEQFLRQCTALQKQLDNYKYEIEGMKNLKRRHLKENLLKDLETLNEQLSNLMKSEKTPRIDSAEISASKTTFREEKVEVKEAKNKVDGSVAKVLSEDSSSDSTSSASDQSIVKRHSGTNDANLRELKDGKSAADQNQFIALVKYEAQDKNDLSLKKNEVIRIITTRQDGWWLAENANGDRGFVPKTFLKAYREMISAEKELKDEEPDKPLLMPRQILSPKSKSTIATNSQINKSKNRAEKTKILEGKKQQNEENVAIIKGNTTTVQNSTIAQNIETKILEESNSESNKVSNHEPELPEPQFSEDTLPKSFIQPIIEADNFGRANDYDNHLTYECYLAPRLSNSNYAFHDIYWNYEDDKLRKRRVRVSKMIKICHLEKVRLNAVDVHCRLVRAYLFDRKASGEDFGIVSNVYTIKAYPRGRDAQTWIFSAASEKIAKFFKTDMQKTPHNYSSFIVRSNYKQKSVVLCLEATVVFTDNEGEMSEHSLGCVVLPIIDENERCCLQNKNYNMKLFTFNSVSEKGAFPVNTQIQISFCVSDVSNNIVHQVDSLPDVFLCCTQFLPMFSYYRRLLGQFLTKDSNNCTSTALKAEPFLATFPVVADQPDIMEMLWQLWKIEEKNDATKKISEMEEAERFRLFFLKTGFILHETIAMPKFNWANARCFSIRQRKLDHFREQYLHDFDVITYLSRQRCHPIDVYSYAVDIIGPHAIR